MRDFPRREGSDSVKKWFGYAALGAIGFLVLCFMFPGDPRDRRAAELCGDGKRLVSMAGATEDEARRLACDHKAARQAYQRLDAREHGS